MSLHQADVAAKRKDEAKKEFEDQQEFFRNTEMLSETDKRRLRNKQQLSFMYQKPPGYEAMLEREQQEEIDRKVSARLPEFALQVVTIRDRKLGSLKSFFPILLQQKEEEERIKAEQEASRPEGEGPLDAATIAQRKKHKFKKDVYGRNVVTPEEFPELKNAPQIEGLDYAKAGFLLLDGEGGAPLAVFLPLHPN